MWFCPECGNKNDDSYRFCSACGKEKPNIQDPAVTEHVSSFDLADSDNTLVSQDASPITSTKAKAAFNFKLPIWAIAAGVAAVALIVLLVSGVFSSADALLKKADAAFDKDDFKSAYSYYVKYAEKADLSSKETDKLLEETRLALAEEAIDDEDWDEAAEYLDKLDGKEAEELIKECNLGLAEEAIDKKDWDEAKELLEDCDPEDAKDLIAQCNYHFAVEAMEKEDWETAAELLKGIDYSDSEELLEECESYLGPDSAFLDALSEGVIAYMNADKSSFSSRLSAVQGIQTRISEYSSEEFYDENLGILAYSIIENINSQAEVGESLEAFKIYYRYYQKTIWAYMVDLCDYMAQLNSNYGFLDGNSKFQSEFVNAGSTWESQLDDIYAFDDDFYNYRSRYTASGWAGTQQFIKYVNTSGKYFESVTFYFDLYDKNDQYVRTSSTTIEVPMNEQTRIYFDCDVNKEKSWDWDWYINF